MNPWGALACGLSRFAEKEGVNARTLAFWKWRLKRDGSPDVAVKHAPRTGKRVAFVELVSPSRAAAPSETRTAAFEVVLPIGYRVRLAPGFERTALVELLDVLEARQ
jgi:hypothetical protein